MSEKNTSYRIAVIGVDGTGRTTLAQELSKELQISCLEDLSYAGIRALGYQTIYEVPDSASLRIQLLEGLTRSSLEEPSFVSDSGVIDWFAQWQRWEWGNVAPFRSEALYNQAKTSAEAYTHVIFLQPSFQPPYNGFRWLEPNHRIQVTRLIRSLTIEWGLMDRTLELEASSPEAALEQALFFLKQK